MPHIHRTLEAVRAAQPRQIAGRARRLVPPRALAPSRVAVPRLGGAARGLGAPAAPQYGSAPRPEESGTFEAYGVVRRHDATRFWSDDSDGLLFLFHLHGFSTLAEYARRERTPTADAFWRGLIGDWVSRHAVPRNPAWHPYPTSVRLIAWSAAADLLDDAATVSFGRQAVYLGRALEYDVGGNHLLKNAVALVFAGCATDDSRLVRRGLRVLERELRRQLLPDGGHEERSPAYHREIAHELAEVAELLRRTARPVPPWLEEAARRMEDWLAALTGPDGELPLLNDAWAGPARANRSDEAVTALEPTGYYVCRSGGDQLVFDAGPLSPPHLPPHAHADALSVTAWRDGRPLLVDPGSYSYTGPARDEFRGTGAHNTVQVDGEDQCVFWGDFRASALPAVAAEPPERLEDVVVLRGSHDGYTRLDDPVTHHRTVLWAPGDGLVIADVLEAGRPHEVSSSLTFAPGASPDDGVTALGQGRISEEERRVSRWLGQSEPARALVFQARPAPGEPFGWALLRPGARASLEGGHVALERGDGRTVRVPVASR